MLQRRCVSVDPGRNRLFPWNRLPWIFLHFAYAVSKPQISVATWVAVALRSCGRDLAEQRLCRLLKSVGRLLPYVSAGGERFSGVRGGVPERPKGAGCKPAGLAYGGSNPPAPIEQNMLP